MSLVYEKPSCEEVFIQIMYLYPSYYALTLLSIHLLSFAQEIYIFTIYLGDLYSSNLVSKLLSSTDIAPDRQTFPNNQTPVYRPP